MRQLPLFPDILKSADLLVQDSPRDTFYRIWIEEYAGNFHVCKESGVKDRVRDRRKWPASDRDQAECIFERRVKAKTNPERKSPRKYLLIKSTLNG